MEQNSNITKEQFSTGLEYIIGGMNFLKKAINADPDALREPVIAYLLEKMDPKISNIFSNSYAKYVEEYSKKNSTKSTA